MGNFLSASWENLAMANFAVSPEILTPYLPKGTELDTWNGIHYVSLVGFMFTNVRVLGIPVPFHTDFEEVNLRFYVKRKEGGIWKRGVVFIKEIVPKTMISFVANTIYHEHYVTLNMNHQYARNADGSLFWEYEWEYEGEVNTFSVTTENTPVSMPEGSEAEFITEHYWGYTRVSETETTEYEVKHPKWEVYPVKEYKIRCQLSKLYGKPFQEMLEKPPLSVFLAKGSPIEVMGKKNLAFE